MRGCRPNVLEQIAVVRAAADLGAQALVVECMALAPALQWLCEWQLIRSTHAVITNAREDHLAIGADPGQVVRSSGHVAGVHAVPRGIDLPARRSPARDLAVDLPPLFTEAPRRAGLLDARHAHHLARLVVGLVSDRHAVAHGVGRGRPGLGVRQGLLPFAVGILRSSREFRTPKSDISNMHHVGASVNPGGHVGKTLAVAVPGRGSVCCGIRLQASPRRQYDSAGE